VGLHYGDPGNTYTTTDDEKKARQIYCIFLLGHDIDIPGRPVIQVDYHAKDISTSEELNPANEFIQGLHHRSWIVQIKQLKQRRRNDLEKLLDIFDQENLTKDNHVLNVSENDFPEIYRPIIHRLRAASESEDVQIEMEMEDDYLQELQDKERLVEEKDKIIVEQEKLIEELTKQLAAAQEQK
jgi:alpha-galactosidase/6-phospho-beta-glucosidase family protein